jgi:hypothetical protein
LSEESCGDNDNISGVLNGNDDSSGQLNFLPGLFQIHNIDTVIGSMTHILSHVVVHVLGSKVALGGKEP